MPASSAQPAPTGPSDPHNVSGFVRWAIRHGRAIWFVALLLALPGAVRTTRLYLRLNSELEQLLPPAASSVKALRELRTRMPGLQHLGILVEFGAGGDPQGARRLLDDLGARIRAYPPELVRHVRTGVAAEKAFVSQHGPMYVSLDDLVTIRERLAERKRWEFSKKLDMLLSDDGPPTLDFSDLERKYKARATAVERFGPDGRFENAEMGVSLLLVELGGDFSTGLGKARELTRRIQADLVDLGFPGKYGPQLRYGFTGEAAVLLEEVSGLAADLTLASLLVVAAVMLVLSLYFRWWRAIPIIFLPLLVSTVVTFGLVTLPPFDIRELNSNTAFLGSIIIGNGINFGIILLARYVEVRRRGRGVEAALVEAVAGARAGTLVAALAAGVAYASLVITQFRGFRQFGVIGGIGMALSWGAAFLLMPSLVAWLDRGPSGAPRSLRAGAGLMPKVARWVAAYPTPIVIVGAILTAVSLLAAARFDLTSIETDFSRLRRRDTWTEGERFWGGKMDRLLGRYLSPTVLLADSPEQARLLANRIREATTRPPLDRMVAEVRGIDDVVPPDQQKKLDEIARIRGLITPAVRAEVAPDKLAALDRFLGDGSLRPVNEGDVPSGLTAGMKERDGRVGNAVLVFPRPSQQTWRGQELATMVGELRKIAATENARVAGALPLSADIIDSIQHDGPIASLAALLGVMVLVLLMFRTRAYGLYVIASLIVGVLWMLAASMFLRIKINFANFIAFPITFGIGVDYAVNVMSRYVQDGEHDIQGAIRSTGAAVGLCSLTTIIGYSSLLLAQNQGLFLFGLMAVIGEITCLVTAIALLPAVLWLLGRRRRLARAASLT